MKYQPGELRAVSYKDDRKWAEAVVTTTGPAAAIKLISDHYEGSAESVDRMDGVGMAFGDWRFNLRASNTEPVIRLNVESRGDEQLMADKRDELLALLDELS